MSFTNIDPEKLDKKDLYQFIIGSITPRPIALVSTIDKEGKKNLAPYSFFNAFSASPPILVFSSNLIEGDRPQKDTLLNLQETQNCVINIVNHDILRQMTLTSIAFDHGVSEFEKSGLTPLKSEKVDAFRVKESPVQFECTINNIIALGSQAGAANLIICKVLKMHVLKNILTSDKRRIDPQKLDVIGRLGRSNYVRVNGQNIISMYQSTQPHCIGFDGLPRSIKESTVLTGNEIASLASLPKLPSKNNVLSDVASFLTSTYSTEDYHRLCRFYIQNHKVEKALNIAMIPEIIKENYLA